MLKKRLIFTLLYDHGSFMLSRNFRLQKVGNLEWLKKNYDFSHISCFIDELVVLDVTRGDKNLDNFCSSLKLLTDGCFVPISAGGGVNSTESARTLLRSGADKVVVNSGLYGNTGLVEELASEFGQQCLIGSMDIKATVGGGYQVWSENGMKSEPDSAKYLIERISNDSVGEIYLNSMDRDGTGQGFDFGLLDLLPDRFSKPVILAGGAGNANHLFEGLSDSRVDAVATANLFNFVGNGLQEARNSLLSDGIELPMWNAQLLKGQLNSGKIDVIKND
jgi:cyclase